MTLQPAASSGHTLLQVGNIAANEGWVVTPAGTWRADAVNATAYDQTSTTTHTPAWAIVLVVVFIWFFLLSLLFLLAREVRLSGYIAIQVTAANGQSYTEHVPVGSAAQRADVLNRVNYLQSLIGHARARSAR